MAGLDISKYSFAGGAPLSSLNYSGSPTANMNPFKSNSQEYGQYEQYYNNLYNPQPAAAPDPAIAQAQRLAAVQPSINQYEAGKPLVSQKIGEEKTRLTGSRNDLATRYDMLLQDIAATENKQTSALNTTLKREYGMRGLSVNDSGYDYDYQSKANPIISDASRLRTMTGFERESGLRKIDESITGLTTQELEQMHLIDTAIANLKSGAGNAGIDDALRILQMNQEQASTNRSLAVQERAAALEEEISRYSLDQAKKTDPLNLQKLLYEVNNLGKTSGGGGLNIGSLADLQKLLGIGSQPTSSSSTQSTFQASTTPSGELLDFTPDTSLFGGGNKFNFNGLNFDQPLLRGGY